MDSALTTVGLPLALGIIMFGLGLSLTIDDFRRVAQHPKVMSRSRWAASSLLLPLVCFGLVKLFDLPPLLAVGMMLLAASPGGTSANLFSHLFRGDVALNVTLTAVNSVISIVSLPLITNLAIELLRPRRHASACSSARWSRSSPSCWCPSRSACWSAPRPRPSRRSAWTGRCGSGPR